MLAALRVAWASSRKGRIGSSARLSWWTKSPSKTTPATSEAIVGELPQPLVPASTSPKTIPVIPRVEVTAPVKSNRPRCRSVSTITIRPSTQTAIPMGTFTNMTQRQDTRSVRRPPATRPVAPPAADTVV